MIQLGRLLIDPHLRTDSASHLFDFARFLTVEVSHACGSQGVNMESILEGVFRQIM